MFIAQNLRDFIDNPMGKGSFAIPNRQLIKDDLNRRYDKLVKDKKIDLKVYKDGDEYYFHFIMPSESDRKNTYDVVLNFTMGDESFKFDNFLNRYYVKFFSNCPSFTYTYAYAFNLYGLFIEHLSNKYERQVLEDDPVVRNPGEVISYEKSIYFACRYLQVNNKYLNKMHINTIAKPFHVSEFNGLIRNTDQIKLEIDKEKARVEREKKEKEEEERKKRKEPIVNKAVRGETEKDKIKTRTSGATINRIQPQSKIRPKKSTVTKTKPK